MHPPTRRSRRLLLAALLGLGALASSSPAASATEGSGDAGNDAIRWTVATADNEHGSGRPNYGYTLEPGESVEDAMIVQNTGDDELGLTIATADGYTTPSGHLDLHPAEVPPEGVGAWIDPAIEELVLAPGESREVAFFLTVPEDVAAGDHTGGIVAVHTSDAGTNIETASRFGFRVHVRVPGDHLVDLVVSELDLDLDGSLNPFSARTARVSYTVRNAGTLRTFYTEQLAVSGPAGLGGREQQTLVEEILPGGEILRTVEVPGIWPLFRLDLDLEVHPQAIDGALGTPAQHRVSAWAMPWTLLLLAGLAIGAGVVIGVRRARRSGQQEEQPETAERPSGAELPDAGIPDAGRHPGAESQRPDIT